ncbi:MAG: 2-oxoglutarate dehydrogenase E1 component [Myxococcota bacterium]
MNLSSLFIGENATYLDDRYRAWLADPSSVDQDLRAMFEQLDDSDGGSNSQPPPGPDMRSNFRGGGSSTTVDPDKQAGVAALINAYRVRGHIEADIDPLGRREHVPHPELSLQFFGLSDADLETTFSTGTLRGLGEKATLRDIYAHLRAVYCGTVGAEFMNIDDIDQKRWVAERLETLPGREVLNRDEELHVLRKLADAENFERLLHVKFPGTKRFSLEGGETLVPLIDILLSEAGRRGVREVVFGMAHRGRLNVLVNILEKPARQIVAEFEDTTGPTQGSGDVKYHLGYSSDTTTVHGDTIHLSLTPNPSHLEAVDAVVQGRVRAKQDRVGDSEGNTTMPLLVHGDAAFIGQGMVAEVFQLSELMGYKTGGTIHVVVNNQIGFTTAPRDSRSTPYATDMARMMAIPILHVNGEDPRAVAAAVKLAVEWRQTFHRDVVVDMYCYRKHGHNEGDEPSFTQPLMYSDIRKRPTPRANYASRLMDIGYMTEADVAAINEASRADLEAQSQPVTGDEPGAEGAMNSASRGRWAQYITGSIHDDGETRVAADRVAQLLRHCSTVPDGFTPHNKVKRLLKQRLTAAEGERPLDWALAEQAAMASLVDDGFTVRMSGQDSGRGTFSQRHAVLTDITDGSEFCSLSTISDTNKRTWVIDSNLSEAGVLGFEFGYSLDTPDGLILWEAQFGDFSNGAQVIIDQFITSSEQKWGRLSGLVMLLPHGFEGQGPEHSSARLERFLMTCAQDNIQVANLTTPANYFHALRRQVVRNIRKPLVLMTPKSLLRHASCTSTIDDLANGSFEHVIADPARADRSNLKRVIFCSGKVYYDLVNARDAREDAAETAIHRVEMLYPFPERQIRDLVAESPDARLVWCQEEPRNMGAWPVLAHWFMDALKDRFLIYAGRTAAASPATGSHSQHVREHAALLADALTL